MAKKKDNTLLYAGIAAAAILLLKKKDTGPAGVGSVSQEWNKRAYDELKYIIDFNEPYKNLSIYQLEILDKIRDKYRYYGDKRKIKNGYGILEQFYDDMVWVKEQEEIKDEILDRFYQEWKKNLTKNNK